MYIYIFIRVTSLNEETSWSLAVQSSWRVIVLRNGPEGDDYSEVICRNLRNMVLGGISHGGDLKFSVVRSRPGRVKDIAEYLGLEPLDGS